MLEPGSQVAGYTIERELARGGMGAVYLAHDPALGRQVALKTILAGAGATPEELARFGIEAEATARLRHPGIVAVHAAGLHGGLRYLVMDLVEGESLQARLRREGPLPIREAVEVTARIADAVDYAHALGILHRDLKPANVLMTAEGVPRVTDFGLAKRVEGSEALTRTGQIVGTLGFMPPEQTGSDVRVDARADVYGLGATLYALLTGQPPFRGASPLNVLSALLNKPAPDPSSLRDELPADLDAIVRACLAKEPADRYPSAAALSADLRRHLAGRPIAASSTTPWTRVMRAARRHPRLSALGALAGLALLLSGGALAQESLSRGAPERRPQTGAPPPRSSQLLTLEALATDDPVSFLRQARHARVPEHEAQALRALVTRVVDSSYERAATALLRGEGDGALNQAIENLEPLGLRVQALEPVKRRVLTQDAEAWRALLLGEIRRGGDRSPPSLTRLGVLLRSEPPLPLEPPMVDVLDEAIEQLCAVAESSRGQERERAAEHALDAEELRFELGGITPAPGFRKLLGGIAPFDVGHLSRGPAFLEAMLRHGKLPGDDVLRSPLEDLASCLDQSLRDRVARERPDGAGALLAWWEAPTGEPTPPLLSQPGPGIHPDLVFELWARRASRLCYAPEVQQTAWASPASRKAARTALHLADALPVQRLSAGAPKLIYACYRTWAETHLRHLPTEEAQLVDVWRAAASHLARVRQRLSEVGSSQTARDRVRALELLAQANLVSRSDPEEGQTLANQAAQAAPKDDDELCGEVARQQAELLRLWGSRVYAADLEQALELAKRALNEVPAADSTPNSLQRRAILTSQLQWVFDAAKRAQEPARRRELAERARELAADARLDDNAGKAVKAQVAQFLKSLPPP